jgi:ubiquinone/menaquinone biosynthesis C-methylase UbiE
MVQDAANFGGSIPEYYDRILGAGQFERFAADLAARLPARPPGDVLELACGTGLVTRHLRERLDAGLKLVASDLSPDMLAYGKRKLAALSGIDWKQADATKLPFDQAAFGAVVCAFGIMFFPDKPAAMKEARRVLRRGGTLLINVWDGLANNPHGAANAQVMDELFPDDPEMKFAAIPYGFNDRGTIDALLKQSGFADIRFQTARHGVSAASARDWATGQMRGTPRGLLVEKKGMKLDDVIDKVAAALAKVGGERPFRVQAQALVVEARAQ